MSDPTPASSDPLLRGSFAPSPRSLVQIFRETVAQAGDSPAIDAGNGILTYAEFEDAADEVAQELNASGIGPGDKVGVRVKSGTTDLYVAIMGILLAGAAYVPVDFDDPDERARLVFGEADVAAIIGDDLAIAVRRGGPPLEDAEPGLDDDAWVIFTSGSTGTPKGVAVSHRNAGAFVDAEAKMFLQEAPLGVGDRVMAGLSVAFDASCEEMWLAWRYGGCLVPAPRALVRSGIDVGPWLVANEITVVSTVPTLVALWPEDSLAQVRLLIMGGEACPPELAARLVREGREVWNTYGPTEATVVACGALLTGDGPIHIGLPLDGWDLAVVDAAGMPVKEGETGELIIGGVGLARYLDPAKDAEKYAPMPTLGWERAYRSGDNVSFDGVGLLFAGRMDDQIKLGGRRIELGEIDSALLGLPGVNGAAAAVRKSKAGNQLLVGYVAVDETFDQDAAVEKLRHDLPAALVPRIAVVDTLPTRTSGKVDRDALPWPLPQEPVATGLSGTPAWIAEIWGDVLGAAPSSLTDDFFNLGGGSLTAAQVVGRIRHQRPDMTVGDLYENPTLQGLSDFVDTMGQPDNQDLDRSVRPIPRKTQVGQIVGTLLIRSLAGPRWLTWIAFGCWVLQHLVAGYEWLPHISTPLLLLALVVFVSPPGRMLLAAATARLILHGVQPGEYPRGGKVHLRLWLASHVVDELGAMGLSGAPYMNWFARLLGAKVGRNVDLHSLPPVTGMLKLGKGASIEPEVDLSGHWIDGNVLHLGPIEVGARARVGARSMLLPGAVVGSDCEIAPGSAVFGEVPSGEYWSGSPAQRSAAARGPWSARPDASRGWVVAYAAMAMLMGSLPMLAIAAGAAWPLLHDPASSLADGVRKLWWLPLSVLIGYAVLLAAVLLVVRISGLFIKAGVHPVRGGRSLAVWSTMRVLDEARTWLFPLYSSMLTPMWLRALGARIGKDVEASTTLMIPSLTQVNDQAFLADDTLIGGYELGGGWLRVERVKIGKRAFVGNSGMAAPGRRVPKASLVAVLSAAPRRKGAKSGASWLGSPPTKLRRAAEETDSGLTYAPSFGLKVLRALVECCRIVVPMLSVLMGAVVVALFIALLHQGPLGLLVSILIAGPVLAVGGLVAALMAVLAKWLLVGRVRPGKHALWTSFIWRNELADTFVEMLAAPWFANAVLGTPLLNVWFRAMGAEIGRGVWCETYWLPEADLVHLGDGATVNAGSVVQTHLFHDRMFGTDDVVLRRGATLGPNSVILPAATLGRHAIVGPVSLVMRGEAVPDKTAWIGNPIGPWVDDE